jgi:hypothetical protein
MPGSAPIAHGKVKSGVEGHISFGNFTGHATASSNMISESLKILQDCVIFVDVRTDDGDEAASLFVEMLEGVGAKVFFLNVFPSGSNYELGSSDLNPSRSNLHSYCLQKWINEYIDSLSVRPAIDSRTAQFLRGIKLDYSEIQSLSSLVSLGWWNVSNRENESTNPSL